MRCRRRCSCFVDAARASRLPAGLFPSNCRGRVARGTARASSLFPPTIGGSANGFGALARLDQKGYRATPPVCRGPSAGSPPRGTVKSDGRMWRTACATHRKACRFLVECSASRAAVVPESMIGRTVIVSRFTVGRRGVFRAVGHRWSEGGIPGVPPGIPDDPPVGILSGSSVREHFRPMPRDPRDAR